MRILIYWVFFLVASLCAWGRYGDVIVSVQPIDSFTGERLWNAYAQVIDSHGDTIADSRHRVTQITTDNSFVCVDLPDSTATYTMRTIYEGYEPGEVKFETRRHGKDLIELSPNKMVKIRKKELDEVTVTASKVKMVMRGDTIVYNADAFQLANGSMLDALVSRLPGVALEDGGRITVNGRKVDELTINGEDFFQGNPRIALENLPAFTVKEIKVFEHGAIDSYITGNTRQEIDRPLRMDVNLKKEYNFGWMGNAEVGYGLHNRYMGKAFAFGFTNKFRFSAFANFNNIKDSQSSSGGRWSSGQQHNGEMDMQMGGADYMVKNNIGEAWTVRAQGNLIAQGDQSNLIAERTETTFYPTRDLYKLNNRQDRSKRFSLKSSHTFEIKLPQVYASIIPSIDYRRNNQRRAESEKSAYDLAAEELIYTYAVHSLENTDALALNLNSRATLQSKWRNDFALLHLDFSHNNSYDNLFRDFSLNYFNSLTPDNVGIENNRTRFTEYTASVGGAYVYIATRRNNPISFNIVPSLDYNFRNNNNDISRRKPESDEPFGNMASDQIKYLIDLNNSYNSRKYAHRIIPGVEATFGVSRFHNSIRLGVKENFLLDHIDYLKASEESQISRQKALPEVSLRYTQSYFKLRASLLVEWTYKESSPNLHYLINTTDITDPLNRFMGNRNLKNASENSIRANLRMWNGPELNISWKKMNNLVAYCKFHDEATGVNTWQPMNVNGNWTLSADFNYGKSFGEKQNWSLSTETAAIYNHNVDLVSLSDSPEENLVRNTCLTEDLYVKHNFGKSSAQLGFSGLWRHATSARQEFATINAFDITPSFLLNLSLPYDFQIESDLKLYLRRGYSARELNTTEWGWNATLSKSILKGNLKFSLTGVDILGQIKPIQTVLNAQGRTETRYNTLPRYAMLHIIYRLNIQPRKK